MREGEILGRSHLDEARGRALELAGLVAFGSLVEGGRLGCSRGKKLHAGIVKRVDQHNETLGLIAVGVGHDWHAINDNRVKFVCDSQIVSSTQRLLAEVVKAETSRSHGSARHEQQVSLHVKIDRMGLLTTGEAPPRDIQRLARSFIGGDMPHRYVDELFETEVSARREPHDLKALVEQMDKRQEQG